MRKILCLLALAGTLTIPAAAQLKLPKNSPSSTVRQTIGLTDVTVDYHRPTVKGRQIWGKLVPMDSVWRTGANEATTIQFTDDVKIEGQPIPAGKYALLTIPGKTEWTIIFNKKAEQWGAYDYKKSDDALRVKVKAINNNPNVEALTIGFADLKANNGLLTIEWEKVKIAAKIEVEVDAKAMKNIKEAIAAKPDNDRTYQNAANYALNNNVHLDSAIVWINKSVSLKETMWNSWLKTRIYAKAGKFKEALAAAEHTKVIGAKDPDYYEIKEELEKAIAEYKTK